MAQIFNGTRNKTDRPQKRATAEQMGARKELSDNREASRARKIDTRRKILLGGGLMALARAGDKDALTLMQKIIDHQSRDLDRKTFANWSVTNSE